MPLDFGAERFFAKSKEGPAVVANDPLSGTDQFRSLRRKNLELHTDDRSSVGKAREKLRLRATLKVSQQLFRTHARELRPQTGGFSS
jgi:hypothetical protein